MKALMQSQLCLEQASGRASIATEARAGAAAHLQLGAAGKCCRRDVPAARKIRQVM